MQLLGKRVPEAVKDFHDEFLALGRQQRPATEIQVVTTPSSWKSSVAPLGIQATYDRVLKLYYSCGAICGAAFSENYPVPRSVPMAAAPNCLTGIADPQRLAQDVPASAGGHGAGWPGGHRCAGLGPSRKASP